MASDKNEWLWFSKSHNLIGFTEERAKAHRNQFVKKIENLLKVDYPEIKFVEQNDYLNSVSCNSYPFFDKESYEFLRGNCLLYHDFIEISPVFCGYNSKNFTLKIDKSEYNPDDLSHYKDCYGNYVKVFPNITLYKYKVRSNFNLQFIKGECDDWCVTGEGKSESDIHPSFSGFNCDKKIISKVKSPEISIINTIKKNMAVLNALVETYKEPYEQWMNFCNKQTKIEEVLRKKLLILAEK